MLNLWVVSTEPKSEAVRAMYWRDEILQVMFWLRGEGFGETVNPSLLERFLGVDAEVGLRFLDRLLEEGLLVQTGPQSYTLSPTGLRAGADIFAEEFAELTKPTHGECGPDCWCHNSAEEAEACLSERLLSGEHSHDHVH